MTQSRFSFAHLSDEQLLAEVMRLAACERQATAELIRSLMEVDSRRLYLAQGFSSLFTYCTQALHLSEHAALGRIEVARAARRLPAVLDLLLDGSVTATNVRILSPHLTEENHKDVLQSARHKSKREVEEIVARLRPLPDVAALVRKLPERRIAAGESLAPSSTAGRAAGGSADRLVPLTDVAVASAVRRNDRCGSRTLRVRGISRSMYRARLSEFHHVVPFAAGGSADASNIQLRCRGHNVFESELFFGVNAVREETPASSSG